MLADEFIADFAHIWLQEHRFTRRSGQTACLVLFILSFSSLLHLLHHFQQVFMPLKLLSRSIVALFIILCLHLHDFGKAELCEKLRFFGKQSQGKCYGSIVMSKGKDLDDYSQFVDAPPERGVFEYVQDHVRSYFPNAMAHFVVQPQDWPQLAGIPSLSQPFQLASRFEIPLQVTSHHINTPMFGGSCQSQEVSKLLIDFSAFKKLSFSDQVLLQVSGVEQQEALQAGNISVVIEELVQDALQVLGQRRDMQHFSTALCCLIKGQQIGKALIRVECGQLWRGDFRVVINDELRIWACIGRVRAAVGKVDEQKGVLVRRIASLESLYVGVDLLWVSGEQQRAAFFSFAVLIVGLFPAQ